MVKNPEIAAFEFLKKQKLAVSEKWDFFVLKANSLKIELSEPARQKLLEGEERGFGLRFCSEGRIGFAFSNDFSKKQLSRSFQKARENAELIDPDPLKNLAQLDEKNLKSKIKKWRQLKIPAEKFNPQKLEDFLKTARNACLIAHPKIFQVPRVAGEIYQVEIFLGNSAGFGQSFFKNIFDSFCQAVARDEGEATSGSEAAAAFSLKQINPEKLGQAAAERALKKLGGRKVSSGLYEIIFSPEAASQILSLLASALSGEEVMKNRSFLKNKLNQKIASEKFTLIDNGLMRSGLASAPFDAEGTPTGKTVLFEGGILKNYFQSVYSSRFFKTRPTGNTGRPSFSTLPVLGPTNFYLAPGQIMPEKLISSVKKGILVTDLFGLHTADRVTGEFSLGIEGQYLEDGQVTFPVKGVALAGNLENLLANISAVAEDLNFFLESGYLGSPHFLVSSMTISGE